MKQDQLISVMTAISGKKNGFDWKTSGCYVNQPKWVLSRYGHIQDYNKFTHSLGAPTQSLLQKWLRETHSIHIVILPTETGYLTYKLIDIQMDPDNPIERPPYENVNSTDYSTYEEAMEMALQEGLTSIK